MKQKLKLFLLTQNKNSGYDTYDSCIVAASTPEEAVKMQPDGGTIDDVSDGYKEYYWSWANPEDIVCKFIGDAAVDFECGVVLASFNAG